MCCIDRSASLVVNMDNSDQAEQFFSDHDFEKLLDLSHFVDLGSLKREVSARCLDELTSIVALNNSELPTENKSFSDDQATHIHAGAVEESIEPKRRRAHLEKVYSTKQLTQLICVQQEQTQDTIQHDVTPAASTSYFESAPSTSAISQEEQMFIEQKYERSISFNHDQLRVLELEFQKYPYPDDYTRSKLAIILNTSNEKVKKWFEHRRMKQKKLAYQREDQKEEDQCAQVFSKPKEKFTESQLATLEDEYIKCQYPDLYTYCEIASKLGLTEKRVRYWFQKRRAKQASNQESKRRAPPLNGTQLAELIDEFEKCQCPGTLRIIELAAKLNLSARRVRLWFTKRRYTLKKLSDSQKVEATMTT